MRYTHRQIYDWLLQWLRPQDDPALRFLTVDGTIYECCFYFRIAFMVYGIYYDTRTQELIWFVYENNRFTHKQFLDAKRFKTSTELREHIVNTFYKQWNRV
jgi:hypothetical protein